MASNAPIVPQAVRATYCPQRDQFYADHEHAPLDTQVMAEMLRTHTYRRKARLNQTSEWTHAVEDVFGRWALVVIIGR